MKCSFCQYEKQETQFYKRSNRSGYFTECKSCFLDRMNKKHDLNKKLLVEYLGGSCSKCKYNKSYRILVFHHKDPSQKQFGIAKKLSCSLKFLKAEADKCVLLCPNCHAEKHLGLW